MELFASLIRWLITFFTVAIIVRAMLSFLPYFVRPPYHPIVTSLDRVATQITEPVLAPVRRMLPSFGGLDLSPMVVIIVLIIIQQAIRGL